MLRKIALAALATTSILAGAIPASSPAAANDAAGAGRWTKLGRTTTNFAQPGLVRGSGATLHALWTKKSPADPALTDLMHTRITDDGDIAGTDQVVSGWNFIWSVPDVVSSPVDSSLVGIWGGIRSVSPTETNANISAATAPPSGTDGWTLREGDVSEGQGGAASSMGAVMVGSYPFFTWAGSTGTFVHRGLDPSTPDSNLQTPLGGCCGYSPDIAATAPGGGDGRIWVAWYSNSDGHEGVWAQQIDATTGAPMGSAAKMPGSTTPFNGSPESVQQITRTPIAADQSGANLTYVAYSGGYPAATKMLVWRITPNGPADDSVLVGKATASSGIRSPAVTTDEFGHAWVVWSEGGTRGPRIFARRSNVGGTRWGATVVVNPPADSSGCQSINGITPESMGGNVAVIATISEGCTNNFSLWHTEIEPGLSLNASPSSFRGRERVTFKVSDAGAPVQGAKVTVDGKSATTDAEGIAHIVLGPYARDQRLVATATRNGYVADRLTLRAQN